MKTTFPRNILNQFVLSAILSLVMVTGVFAAATIDNSFLPIATKAFNSSQSLRSLAQPDGKVIIWGTNFASDTSIAGRLARLNTDGSLDLTFSYCDCSGFAEIDSVRLQPDGKILIAGTQGTSGQVIRLNSDGSLESSFNGYLGGSFGRGRVWDVLSDGRILAELIQSSGGNTFRTLFRLTSTGTKDPTFPASGVSIGGGSFSQSSVTNLIGSPDGKMYILSSTVSFGVTSTIGRRNADGSVDSTFEVPTFAGGLSQQLTDIALQPDGKLLVSGFFETVNGVSRPTVARLHPAGNVDLSFVGPGLPSPGGLHVLPDGKIYFVAMGSTAGGAGEYRLNSDGTLDSAYVGDPSIAASSFKVSVDGAGRMVFFGSDLQGSYRFFRLSTSGSNDLSFDPKARDFASVSVAARQPDGKYIVAGEFDRINNVNRQGIARISADGTIDASFDGGTGFSSPPREMVVQADGKLLAIGDFTTFDGATVSRLVRINGDGTRDTGFNVTITQSIWDIELQSDGSVLIAGSFETVNGTSRSKIARLNSDGSLDTAFGPLIGSGTIYSIARLSDGKLMVGGSFTGVDGFNRSNLVRLNANTSLDQSFNASSVNWVNRVIPQIDGKYLLVTGDSWGTQMARRNADGTADATFAAPEFTFNGSTGNQRIYDVQIGSDGSIIVGGWFQRVGSTIRSNLVRLRSNGEVDRLFFPAGAIGEVRDLLTDPDGKVVVAGSFTKLGTSARTGIARIVPGVVADATPFDFDGDGRADVSVFRASEGRWYILQSADLTLRQVNFAIAGDIPTPADFDGDGKTDVAIYRPSNGDWWSISSVTGQQINGSFGLLGNIPLPQDVTGDGRADYVTYNTNSRKFNRISSANGSGSEVAFGLAGDKPVIGDFNGDGISDPAIYRPSDGNWWWKSSGDGIDRATKWGLADDKCVPADYTGDGRADFGIYRPSTGVWYIYDLANNASIIYPFGTNGDRPVSADFDGDGRADTSVFRPSDGIWYLLRSTAGYTGYQWGIATDAAVPNVYVPQ